MSVAGAFPYVPAAEARAEFALTRRLDLDGNFFWLPLFLRNLERGTFMGGAALHYEAFRWRFFRLRLTGGLGLGRGGTYYVESADTNRTPKFAGGGLIGVDLGFRIVRYFGVYWGNHLHVSAAPPAPVTLWGYHVLGFHGEFRGFFAALEGGIAYYYNRLDSGPFVPIAVYFALGYRWGPETPSARRPRRPPPAPPISPPATPPSAQRPARPTVAQPPSPPAAPPPARSLPPRQPPLKRPASTSGST